MTNDPGQVTRLLANWGGGDEAALEKLLPLVQQELRGLASAYLRKERSGHTLQTTALVNEAYLRLMGGSSPPSLESRRHFLVVAARAMRRILVDHARRRQADKRLDADRKVSLDLAPEPLFAVDPGVLEIHEALQLLHELHPRQAQVVELRYFGGLTNAEAAEALDISRATLDRDWKIARHWLRHYLQSR